MKKLIYSVAALGVLVVSSCNKNDDGFESIANTQVKISTSSITKSTSTYTGTDLGLSLDYGTGDRYSVTDSKWTYSESTGSWSTEATVLWKNDTDAVDILAFAPYEDDFFNIIAQNKNNITIGARKVPFYIQADQSSGTVESDFVAFESLQFVPSAANLTNGAVPITFEHVLSQLNITLTYGEEFYEFFPVDGVPTVDYVEVNVYQIAVYDFDSKVTTLITKKIDDYGHEVTPTTDLSKIAVKAYPTTANKTYTVILPPQTYTYNSVASENIMITAYVKYMDDTTEVTRAFEYYVPTAGYTFEQGKSYTMNVRVGKDRLYIEDNVVVEDWNGGAEDLPLTGGDAEEDAATFGK